MNRLHSFAVALLLALPVAATASMAQADLRGPVGLVDYEVLKKNVYPIASATSNALVGAGGPLLFTAHKVEFQLGPEGSLQGVVVYYDSDGDDRVDAGEGELSLGTGSQDFSHFVLPTGEQVSDPGDDKALIIETTGPATAAPVRGAYEYKVHVRDYKNGGAKANLVGSLLTFELHDVGTTFVHFASTQGLVVPQYFMRFVVETGNIDAEGNVLVRVPTSLTPIGPVVALANAAGVTGCTNALKSALQHRPEADYLDLDHGCTPVVQLWDMGCDLLARDCDGDGFTTAFELGLGGAQPGPPRSDPTDPASTPISDDDCDQIPNQEEQVPSWLLTTQDKPCMGGA